MKQWHALSANDTINALKTSAEKGLSEKTIEARLEEYGPNTLVEGNETPWYAVLGRQFKNLLILILVIAAGISLVVGEAVDAVAIIAIIVLNGILGFVQEWKAETALKNLKTMLSPTCRVVRDSKEQTISAENLVPGDVVLLESGNAVPADIRLLQATNLRTNEAALTGESAPVDKQEQPVGEDAPISEQVCMVWTGTEIVNGRGRGVVVATGMATEFGKIAGLTGSIEETDTRLQRQLDRLAKQLAVLAILVSAAVVLVGWLGGKELLEVFMAGISLAVAAVPEGLPAVVTVTLAVGVGIMARRKALLRHLQAAETLGATSVICSDKTGTMTKNEMTIKRIWLSSGNVSVSGAGYDPTGEFRTESGGNISLENNPDLLSFLQTGYICNNAGIEETDKGWKAIGSPTEAAFIVAARKANIAPAPDICCENPFNSERKRMSVVVREGSHLTSYIKGAPEVIMQRSDKILVDGEEKILSNERRREIEAAYKEFASFGLRTLAVARKEISSTNVPDEEEAESGLTFLGIAGIIDPPREEVKEAIRKTRSAGIKVIMITGDSPDTALAIAEDVGLKAHKAVTGTDVAAMSDEELLKHLKAETVFARAVPEDKYRIVKLLQGEDMLVAMTGDGVNDAPALKQADIGIAMGIRGTDVAKGAADMVLTDDNFASIVNAIEEGRRQYANIQKFVRYLLSSNVGEIVAVFLNILIGGPLILLPVQILWVNLVTDGVTAIALGVEKAEPDIMAQPPRQLDDPILNKTAIAVVGFMGAYIGLVVLGFYYYYLKQDFGALEAAALANTMAFTGLVVMEKVNVLNFRNFHGPLSGIGWFSNKWLWLAIVTMIGLQVLAVYTPFLQGVLGTVPMRAMDWGLLILVSLPLFIVPEIYKSRRFKAQAL